MTTANLILFHLTVFALAGVGCWAAAMLRRAVRRLLSGGPMPRCRRPEESLSSTATVASRLHMPGRTKPAVHAALFPVFLLGVFTSVTVKTTAAADRWPSFHNGGNTSVSVKGLPVKWSPEKGVAWTAPLPGYGQSSPVVWKDRVYLTAIEGKNKERCHVLACNAHSGKPLWKQTFPATVRKEYSRMVSRAAPTPLADEHGLYVFFESGDLRSYTHDGKLRWKKTLFDDDKNAFQNGHGYGGSPCQTEQAVILQIDHRGPSYVLAVSKKSGKTLWKTPRKSRASWTSPHVAHVGGKEQVILSSNGTVDGYDAVTGKRLWSHEGISGNVIPSATIGGDLVFVGASVSRRKPDAESAAASNRCLQIRPGSKSGYRLVWKAKKAISYYVSPLVHRGLVYYVNRGGAMYCLDAKTGKQVYARRIAGTCWAQPIAAGDRIFFFGRDGVTTVIKAGPRFEKVADNRLWPPEAAAPPSKASKTKPAEKPSGPSYASGPIVYGVAAVDGAFFVRTGTKLYCLRK